MVIEVRVVLQVEVCLQNQDKGAWYLDMDRLATGLIHTELFLHTLQSPTESPIFYSYSIHIRKALRVLSFRTRTRQDRRPASAWHFDAKAQKTRVRKGALVVDNDYLTG